MPTYDYLCKQCSKFFELQHAISAVIPACPECGGATQKILLSAPATHGHMARGREMAVRSLKPNKNNSGHAKDCPCCH